MYNPVLATPAGGVDGRLLAGRAPLPGQANAARFAYVGQPPATAKDLRFLPVRDGDPYSSEYRRT